MEKKNGFFQLIKHKDSDAVIYLVGIAVFAIISVIALSAYLIGNNTDIDFLKVCYFRMWTGMYCPGCGGTRAFKYLIHGHLIKSFIYHPFVIYFTLVGLFFYISQTIRFITKGAIRGLHLGKPLIWVGIGIIVINWIVKNILLYNNIILVT